MQRVTSDCSQRCINIICSCLSDSTAQRITSSDRLRSFWSHTVSKIGDACLPDHIHRFWTLSADVPLLLPLEPCFATTPHSSESIVSIVSKTHIYGATFRIIRSACQSSMSAAHLKCRIQKTHESIGPLKRSSAAFSHDSSLKKSLHEQLDL